MQLFDANSTLCCHFSEKTGFGRLCEICGALCKADLLILLNNLLVCGCLALGNMLTVWALCYILLYLKLSFCPCVRVLFWKTTT